MEYKFMGFRMSPLLTNLPSTIQVHTDRMEEKADLFDQK